MFTPFPISATTAGLETGGGIARNVIAPSTGKVLWGLHAILVDPASAPGEARSAGRQMLRILDASKPAALSEMIVPPLGREEEAVAFTTGREIRPPTPPSGGAVRARPGGDRPGTDLHRRVAHASIRRFVRCAQLALSRDGPEDVLLARQLVARFARLERRLRGMGTAQEFPHSREPPLPRDVPPPTFQPTTLFSP